MNPKIKVLFFLLGFLSVSSCKKIDELLTFNIESKSEFTVPPVLGVNVPFNVITPDISNNFQEDLKNNNSNTTKVKDVKLNVLNLKILDPANFTFKPFKTIKIYLSAEGLPEILLAFKENIPDTVENLLVMDTTGEKLDEYLKKDLLKSRVFVVNDEAFSQELKIEMTMIFSITANL